MKDVVDMTDKTLIGFTALLLAIVAVVFLFIFLILSPTGGGVNA